MDKTTVVTVVGTLVRHGAGAASAYLVTHGYLVADAASKFTEVTTGFVMFVITLVASYVMKRRALATEPK